MVPPFLLVSHDLNGMAGATHMVIVPTEIDQDEIHARFSTLFESVQ